MSRGALAEKRTPAEDAAPEVANARDVDQRFMMYDIPWEAYVAINDAIGDQSGVRICYSKGTLELMSPGRLHESKKKMIARLLEAFAEEHDIPFEGSGSMTFRCAPAERGAEPDECYYVGEDTEGHPHLVIEVAVSRSAIDKGDLYASLGVRELWIWEDDRLIVLDLGKNGYVEVKRSKLLPGLDLKEFVRFVRMPTQTAAIKAYRKHLQNGRPVKAGPRS